MNTFAMIIQSISLIFAVMVSYYSFHALNHCTKETSWKARFPLVAMFTGACALVLHIAMGGSPHWSTAILLGSFALRLLSDKREPTKAQNRRLTDHILR